MATRKVFVNMFDMNILEVGNPCVVGMIENDFELTVRKALDKYTCYYLGTAHPEKEFEDFLLDEGIRYDELPSYYAEKIADIIAEEN
jgi:hypothetical protein